MNNTMAADTKVLHTQTSISTFDVLILKTATIVFSYHQINLSYKQIIVTWQIDALIALIFDRKYKYSLDLALIYL